MSLLQISEPGMSTAPHEERLAVGIDLGTTNSLVATVRNGSPEVLVDEKGEKLLPSVVRYLENGEVEVGEEARLKSSEDPLNTISSVKRLMGRSADEVRQEGSYISYDLTDGEGMLRLRTVNGEKSPVEVSAEILKKLKSRSEEALGGELVGAVVTVPAYFDDAQRQASFAGKDLPTINDLETSGVLESLSFHCRGYGNYQTQRAIPKLMEGKPLAVYANIRGGSAPIPVEYYEGVYHVMTSERQDTPVYVNGTRYYEGYQVITTAEKIELYIGSSVKLTFSNNEGTDAQSPAKITVKIKGTLKEQIVGLEFVSAMVKYEAFNIGHIKIPLKLSEESIVNLGVANYPERLVEYRCVQNFLDSMNVKRDLDIQKCTDEDFRRLNLLIGAIRDKLPVKNAPEKPGNVQKITIANLKLAVVYLERESGGYFVFDYFGNHFDVSWSPDGSNPIMVSQFFTMEVDDFLTLDNLNLKVIVEDFKKIEVSSHHLEFGNHTMLVMLKAYDKQPSVELLDAAQQLCAWQQEYPEFVPMDLTTINRMQIALRKRELTFQEKSELHAIISNTSDNFLEICAFLLLDEQEEAQKLFGSLSEKQLREFKNSPIYRFCK